MAIDQGTFAELSMENMKRIVAECESFGWDHIGRRNNTIQLILIEHARQVERMVELRAAEHLRSWVAIYDSKPVYNVEVERSSVTSDGRTVLRVKSKPWLEPGCLVQTQDGSVFEVTYIEHDGAPVISLSVKPVPQVQERLEAAHMRPAYQEADTALVVAKLIAEHPDRAEHARANPKFVTWFIGQVMMVAGNGANPQTVDRQVREALGLKETSDA